MPPLQPGDTFTIGKHWYKTTDIDWDTSNKIWWVGCKRWHAPSGKYLKRQSIIHRNDMIKCTGAERVVVVALEVQS